MGEQVRSVTEISSWISVLPSLLWFLFAVALIALFWKTLRDVLIALAARIQAGATLVIGPLGIGPPPPGFGGTEAKSATAEGLGGVRAPRDIEKVLLERTYPVDVTDEIYLVHASELRRPGSPTEVAIWRVRVSVEADDNTFLDDITRVTYRLHDTFPQKVVATEAREKEFELWLNAHGEFVLIAYVERKGKPPLWLTRYIDLPGRPGD